MPSDNKPTTLHTFLLTIAFCLAFCGTTELFVFFAALQILFIGCVCTFYRVQLSLIFRTIRNQHPFLLFFFLAWLGSTFVSFALIFYLPTNGWHRLAALLRQTFILLQIGFCLSIIAFYSLSHFKFSTLLQSFALGVIGIIFLHAGILYFGPEFPSEMWLKDPFLSPNTRDLGDLDTAAIAIFTTFFWYEQQKNKALFFGLMLTIAWAYLLWSGGRTAIASSVLISCIAAFYAIKHSKISWNKIFLTLFCLCIAYALCAQFTLYDWNGLVRYSPEWRPDYNPQADISSGRLTMWTWSIDVIKQSPWIGHGTYTFYFLPERFANQFWHDHPHNLILQSMIEWGLIGTVFLLGLLCCFAALICKQLIPFCQEQNSTFLASISIIAVLLLGSLTGGSLWDFQPTIISIAGFAGALHTLLQAKHSTLIQKSAV